MLSRGWTSFSSIFKDSCYVILWNLKEKVLSTDIAGFHVTSSFCKITITNPSDVLVLSDIRPSKNLARYNVS